jgi:hypothetical protein
MMWNLVQPEDPSSKVFIRFARFQIDTGVDLLTVHARRASDIDCFLGLILKKPKKKRRPRS